MDGQPDRRILGMSNPMGRAGRDQQMRARLQKLLLTPFQQEACASLDHQHPFVP